MPVYSWTTLHGVSYGYICLFVSVYNSMWLYMDCIWPSVAAYSCIWLHVDVYGSISLYMFACGRAWLLMAEKPKN